MANGDIELKHRMLVPVKKNKRGLVPMRFFIPIAAIFLYWFTQKYELVDRSIIYTGCAVIPFAVYFFMRQLKPLILHANGDITIPSTVGPAASFVRKSKIAAYSTLRHSSIALVDGAGEVLGVVRPDNFTDSQVFDNWFRRHYGGLKEVLIDEEKAIFDSGQARNPPGFGNPLFYFVCLVLVAVVVINIYVSYQNP